MECPQTPAATKPHAMRVEFINPFITALQHTFKTMLDCDVRRGIPTLMDGNHPRHQINGIIGLSGDAVGTVVLSLSESVALRAASTMLLCDTVTMNEDVVDAVGELTNMVTGSAKAQLEGYMLSVSLPSVVIGESLEIRFPSNVTPLCVPFSSDWGEMSLEVGFASGTGNS